VKKKVVELQPPNPVVRAEKRKQWARGGKEERERDSRPIQRVQSCRSSVRYRK
jgi:hypothetical protein